MRPILQQGLPKMGVVQMFPWALVYGTLHYSDLDIPNLYTEELVEQVYILLRYGHKVSDTTSIKPAG